MTEPSTQTKTIRAAIETMLTAQPGLTRREMMHTIGIEHNYSVRQIGWQVNEMTRYGMLALERTGTRKGRYYLVDDGNPIRRIIPITATVSRILSGPIRSPMEWSLDYLASATM